MKSSSPALSPGRADKRDLSAQPARHPDEVSGLVRANDLDDLAHDCHADIGVASPADLDQLPRHPADVLVPAVEPEIGILGSHAAQLKHAATPLRVVAERGHLVQAEVRGDNAVETFLFAFRGRRVRFAALCRRARRFAARASPCRYERGQIGFDRRARGRWRLRRRRGWRRGDRGARARSLRWAGAGTARERRAAPSSRVA